MYIHDSDHAPVSSIG